MYNKWNIKQIKTLNINKYATNTLHNNLLYIKGIMCSYT